MAQGRAYAAEMLAYMRSTGHMTLLNHVVKAMVGHGNWGAVEVVFFQHLSVQLIGADRVRLLMDVAQPECDEDASVPVT